ncbi:MAG: hypothetical protein LBT89_06520 [Planctomycetaceae bacterium]|jgi:uroporphyrinogen-III decarboxylase|nr:hypothetical protein [Planctomycetaceae bacterium]
MNLLDNCISGTHSDNKNVWSILAPYSAAAQTEQGLAFYKRTYREPAAVHQQLQRITSRLIRQINRRLPQIISIADPYTNPQTVSETHCRDFSLPYLIRLLAALNPAHGGIIHLCPYCSTLLEKYNLVQVETVSLMTSKLYEDILSEYCQAEKLVLAGKQCIHTEKTNKIFLLHLSDSFSIQQNIL